ncbi:putative small GTPase [Leptomonas pyrrhocoris]|uniref:Putative small GTPase n=1 Tax=Leptomonas pyrrhocoris TaxID=157538 RepID=A0A0N0DWK9_LEPPY|nr:putative small GTPase [Leptomonas pyrrhocoris]KPA81731.1 putative small GTPase [Leptomonas pyrrhocoris]|eukprot:XP_015660170.1 putative small GTPase [Leptomonas pyrrhocoris]
MSTDMLALQKVLLMGLRKSGKSSIQKVVFEGMQPHDSASLATTVQPEKSTVHSNDFVNFEVWDFPGQNDPFDPNNANRYDVNQLLENCGAIVYVLDCRELIDDARARLLDTISAAYRYNPELCVEVFVHKVDALSEDHQADLLASLQRRVEEEAKQRLENLQPLRLNFNLTSIYDHSVFQAFSLVVQKLIKSKTPYITELLQMLNSNSNIDLSYLFLSYSKIYVAVDERNRLKSRTYDLCSDAIEVVVKMSRIYARRGEGNNGNNTNSHNNIPLRDGQGDAAHALATSSSGANSSGAEGNGGAADDAPLYRGANAVIHLSNEDCIYLRELPSSLTLVLMMKQTDLENRVLIDRNVDIFYKAAYDIFTTSVT